MAEGHGARRCLDGGIRRGCVRFESWERSCPWQSACTALDAVRQSVAASMSAWRNGILSGAGFERTRSAEHGRHLAAGWQNS